MKITTETMRRVGFHAWCEECEFTAAIREDMTPQPNHVRAAVKAHILKTGHTCKIEETNNYYIRPAQVTRAFKEKE